MTGVEVPCYPAHTMHCIAELLDDFGKMVLVGTCGGDGILHHTSGGGLIPVLRHVVCGGADARGLHPGKHMR